MDRVATSAPLFACLALSAIAHAAIPAAVTPAIAHGAAVHGADRVGPLGALVVAQRPPYVQRYDWPATWRSLEQLRALTPGSDRFRAQWKELNELAGGRERDSKTLRDRPAIFRSRLLRAELAELAESKPLTVPDPSAAIDFAAGEAWMAARHLVSGPLRVRAFREAIAESNGDVKALRQQRAVDAVGDDVRAGRLTTAEALARYLYDSSQSVEFTLALTRVLRASGRDLEAVPLLEVALERRATDASSRARLALERGRVEENLGHETAAARWFGVSLSEGSAEAAIQLAETALERGDYGGALTLYRALLDDDRAPGPAWRGWALAQLRANRPEPTPSSRNSATL
jgi:tetratricopeptide (TPR) repeat protein